MSSLALLALLACDLAHNPRISRITPRISDLTRDTAHDRALLAAIVHVESRGRDGAVSSKGARGRAQVMPATARALCRDLPWRETAGNLLCARRVIREAKRICGARPERWLCQYNSGKCGPCRYARAVMRKARGR